ncbi:GNAT family N-acetyltransferase [Streptococcus ovuberis]|uniref:GNAT family N-acetyltransferase n=1 Tax=Streptococcus ovuberis TaxID=1936207 RepID=A0A7X6MZM3_9STRE|nr:GNAT family N-acetyltransferase [Streptococcus ovuberis]NKZ20338.1 GNAT family N-acetyltransferase [Streptococcus ovuberis]
MDIISTNCLSIEQGKRVKAFLAHCMAHDKTYKEPYLSNQLNVNPDMPAFFLAYEGDDLIGLLAVYADTPEVDLSLFVAPEHRRKGIARELYQKFLTETASYGVTEVSFIAERAFIEANPGLLSAWGVVIDDDSEYFLGRPCLPMDMAELPLEVSLSLARPEEVKDIAELKARVFETPLELSLTYVSEALADQNSLLYVARLADQVIGTCTVDISSSLTYLYGLAVDLAYRGQGIGSQLVKTIINDRYHAGDTELQIAVDMDNDGAKKLYEQLGFVTQTEVIYLSSKD